VSAIPWRPSAGLAELRRRAQLLAQVRGFFAERGVLEVSTPVMGRTGPPDVHLGLVEAAFPGDRRRFWLQPSPESAMKRLLAGGSGPIYQLGPAFRAGEEGARHNPEFTLLEWYRPGFTLDDLARETDALLARTLGAGPGRRARYRDLFARHAGLDPLEAGLPALQTRAREAGLRGGEDLDRDALLDLLFSHCVEPALGAGVVQVVDFPPGQAAMAEVVDGVARRLEVYVDGMELANGYQELTDAAEQRARFEAALEARRARGAPLPPLDEALLAALEHGLPAGCGIALGFDRLLMLALGSTHIDEVLAFPLARS